jgi:hypothetical protein
MQNSGSNTAVTSSNFKIYLDGKEVPFTSVVTERGYLWKSIRLVAAERYLDSNSRWSYRNHTIWTTATLMGSRSRALRGRTLTSARLITAAGLPTTSLSAKRP